MNIPSPDITTETMSHQEAINWLNWHRKEYWKLWLRIWQMEKEQQELAKEGEKGE